MANPNAWEYHTDCNLNATERLKSLIGGNIIIIRLCFNC